LRQGNRCSILDKIRSSGEVINGEIEIQI
jgi:hypothetical protein